MRIILHHLFDDFAGCLRHLEHTRRPLVAMCAMLVAMIASWFLYVPVHELLHVAGCVITGGEVTKLEIAPQYGGALLARWIPFVVSGGEYAGRLSGFDWKDSDFIYLATVFMPYLLTVLIGVPMLRACTRRWRPVLLGAGVVIGLAPLYNLAGDYYEMGSIVTTRIVTTLGFGSGKIAFVGLRSDDVFKLVGELAAKPATLGLSGPRDIVVGGALIVISLMVGVFLALLTYGLGDQVARVVLGSASLGDSSEGSPDPK